MRVLLYGMQSSGASAVAYTMAQRADCVAFVDIWNMFAAPVLETDADVIAKVVVTTAYPLSVHKARFRPDVTILILRHPVENYESLLKKTYVNESGLLNEKFGLLDKIVSAGEEYDYILYHEDFIFSPSILVDLCKKIGWTLDYGALLYPRGADEIQRFNLDKCPEHRGRLKYGLGQFKQNVQRQGLVSFREPADKTSQLTRICSNLLEKYKERRAERGAVWHVPRKPLLSCRLDHFIDVSIGFVESDKAGIKAESRRGDKYYMPESGQICINAGSDSSTSNVRISGLPGAPFNRLTGVVYLKHPYANDTRAVIRVETSDDNILAQQSLLLSHCGLAYFDLSYQQVPGPVAFYLGAAQEESDGCLEQNTLCFENICLDYIPG